MDIRKIFFQMLPSDILGISSVSNRVVAISQIPQITHPD